MKKLKFHTKIFIRIILRIRRCFDACRAAAGIFRDIAWAVIIKEPEKKEKQSEGR